MRILVTGAKGQLGTELRKCLAGMRAEIGAIPNEYSGSMVDYAGHEELDVSNDTAVDDWFSKREYDLVINCAGYTDVDGCEAREDLAYAVNAIGPRNLARAAERQGAKLLHVSTDYVFPGDDSRPRREDDPTGPINAYGRTKLAGEEMVAAECSRSFVCRTAWLYGYEGNNFVKTMRTLGGIHDEVVVVDDQMGNPTNANDLAFEILRVAATEHFGTYHITNGGTCSRAEFAAMIMVKSGLACKVVPVTSEQYKAANPRSADRPRFTSLENSRLAETVGNDMRPWEQALDSFIANLGVKEMVK